MAYVLRVLVTGEAPKNLLSPIILLAGGFGLVHGAGFANYLQSLFDGPIVEGPSCRLP